MSALGSVLLLWSSVHAASPVKIVSDISFLAPGRTEKLDLYLPDIAGAPRPAVVYFHGGGWVHGDKATDREKEIGGTLAGAGYVFVSANYILGNKVWPTNLEDCRNAVRFIRAHAAQYNVDPDRIAAMGTSAGGHLALLLAYSGDASTRVRAVIDLYGITNLLTRRNVTPDGTALPTLDDAHSVEMLGVNRVAGAAVWKKASPVWQATSSSPPTLIIQGLADPIVDHAQSLELANALKAKGVEHQLLYLKGVGHQFDLETWKGKPLPSDLRPVVLSFLAKHLGASSQ